MGVSLVSEHDIKNPNISKYLKNSSRLPDNELDMLVNQVSQRSMIALEASRMTTDTHEMKYNNHYITNN
jgi:hypothetical protein